MNAVRRFIRTMRASGLFGKASKLARQGRNREAANVLTTVLDILPPESADPAGDPGASSVRLCATTLRAQVAATLGEIPVAVAATREGLRLWEGSGLPRSPKFQNMIEWEKWARAYLAWAEHRGGN